MSYKFIVKLYGVESRRDMINSTVNKLHIPEENIFIDDRPNGGRVLYNAKRAYLSDHGDATHGIFLQDDIEICDDFLNICNKIVETHPDKIISLFPFDYMTYNYELDNIKSPYIYVHTLSACGIIMPIKYINLCFDWIDKNCSDDIGDDMAISLWAGNNGIRIITTIPSLIQHIGDNSILNPKCHIRRTVYYKKNPIADWSNKEINAIYIKSIIAPKCKNVIKIGGILNDN